MLIGALILFVLGLSAIGLGVGLLRLIAPGLRTGAVSGLGLAGMLGLLVAANAAITANFFLPLSPIVGPVILAVGLGIFALVVARTTVRRFWELYGLLVAAFALVAWSLPIGPDGGLYHLPHQMWLASEKIVFGLANFYGRLGFNSTLEPLLALGWLSGANFAIAPLIAVLFSLFFVLFLAGTVRETEGDPVILYLTAMYGVAFLWIFGTVSARNGWVNTDTPAALAALISVYWFIVAAGRRDRDALTVSFAFAAFAVSLKLAVGLVLLLPLALAIGRRGASDVRLAPRSLAMVALFFAPWLARSVVLTGCLAFPVTVSCLPLPWEASIAGAGEAAVVTAYSRVPNAGLEPLDGWSWLPLWFERVFWFLVSWGAVVVLGCVAAFAVGRRKAASLPVSGKTLSILAVYAGAAVALWFVGAPAPRFGVAPHFVLAMLSGLWIVARGPTSSVRLRPEWFVGSVLAAAVVAAIGYGLATRPAGTGSLFAFRSPPVPDVPTERIDDITRPVGVECFTAPPPCSPYGQTREVAIGPYRAYLPSEPGQRATDD